MYEAGAGPLVLCLHGFPDHALGFRHQLDALAAAGYRAVAPTMRGYEPGSQLVDADYHVATLAGDVLAWLDALGERRCHLVGHDWGAMVTYVAAALAPGRFRSITTLAVPPLHRLPRALARYPVQLRNSWYIAFFQLRGLADAVVAREDFALLRRLYRDWSPGWSPPREQLDAVARTFAQPGVVRAALGYYRCLAGGSLLARESRALLRREVQVPTLAVTGAQDGCLDTRLYSASFDRGDFPRGIEVARVQRAGHFVHQERPDEVDGLILRWLARHG